MSEDQKAYLDWLNLPDGDASPDYYAVSEVVQRMSPGDLEAVAVASYRHVFPDTLPPEGP